MAAHFIGESLPPTWQARSDRQSPQAVYQLRGSKRGRSRTSPDQDASLELARRLAPRLIVVPPVGALSLTSPSTTLTPPLSASSSVSSGSLGSLASLSGSYGSFSLNNLASWAPDAAGSPLDPSACYGGHQGYVDSPISDIRKKMSFHETSLAQPMPLTPATALQPNFAHESLPDFDPRRILMQRQASSHTSGPASRIPTPGAPALGRQQLEFDPATDASKPWAQQNFVQGLIDVSMIAIQSIWECTPAAETARPASAETEEKVLPLKYFVQETLRRSRSSCVTLHVALYYLHKARTTIRERVQAAAHARDLFTRLASQRQQSRLASAYPTPPASPDEKFTAAAAEVLATSRDPVICGRRMFLAALIAASKFLQDRTYSNRAWSRLSGLPVAEINGNERALLEVLDYQLFMTPELYANWTTRLTTLQRKETDRPASAVDRTQSEYLPAPIGTQLRAGSMDIDRSPVARLNSSPTSMRSASSGRRASDPSVLQYTRQAKTNVNLTGYSPIAQATCRLAMERSLSLSGCKTAALSASPASMLRQQTIY